MNASSSCLPRQTGNVPPWVRMKLIGNVEELRLGHELHLPAQEQAQEEVVEVGEVVGRQDRGAVLGHVLGPYGPRPVERPTGGVSTMRANRYIQSGPRSRTRRWYFSNISAGRGSM